MTLRFTAAAIWWKGPAPSVFVPLPEEASEEIRALSKELSYGWGVIPVRATIGTTSWTTSLYPKAGIYLLPVKKVVQLTEAVDVGQAVELEVEFG